MKPTDDLIQEHKAITLMLSIMDKIAEQIRDNKGVDIEDIDKITDFLRTFADKCHHGKEESVLFPELVAVGVAKENGPVGVMLHEHVLGRGYISDINAGSEKYKEGSPNASLQIAQGISNYTFLLRNHINKENNVLFPMADKLLSAHKQEMISEKFERIEEDVVGHGVHEQYHKLLGQLKDKYLG